MGNAFGSGNNKRKLSETRDDDEDERDPLCGLPYPVQLIVLDEVELTEEQCEAAGMYLFEVLNGRDRNFDRTSNPVLADEDVVPIQPPSRLSFTEPQRNVIHAISFFQWNNCPPDNDTIRTMGAVERWALWRFWSEPWNFKGGSCYSSGAGGKLKSELAFKSFKSTAYEMNGGERPDEAFFLEQFRVRRRNTWQMPLLRRRWFYQLFQCRPDRVGNAAALWVTKEKQWLKDHGVFSAWEKHRASADFVPHRGWSDEIRPVQGLKTALNARLQCKEFVCPDDDKWYRVLVVRWIPKWESYAVLCYEATLADPTANQTSNTYIHRMQDECFPAYVEDVDDWIERSPKRARIE